MKKPVLIITILILIILPAFASDFLSKYESVKNRTIEREVCRLAKEAVISHIETGDIIEGPSHLPDVFERPAGLFVTIVYKNSVIGCMGTVEPKEDSAKKEIIRSAIMAATRDPWHRNIPLAKAKNAKYIISIPGPLKKIDSPVMIDPMNKGILVRRGNRSALLLPGEARTPEWAVYECKRKAGIPQDRKVEMFIFETVTFGPY